MRTMGWMSIAALGMTGVALWAAGCADWLDLAEDCTFTRTCCADGTLGCLSLDGGPEGGDAEGGTPQCDPTAGAVDEGCGVFVSSSIGNDGNAGTQAAPLKSLAVAATKAGGGYVYACGETFTEALTLASGVKLYGALDCSNGWAYDAQKQTVLTAAAGAVPLRLASTAGATVIHDFAITAADTTTAGGSSIAVLAQAGVTLERVDVTAGTGATGTPGMAQAQVMTPATADGKDGGDDAACSNMAGVLGGGAGKNTCGGIDVGGGLGGQGVAGAPGGNGNPGNPVTPNNSGTGQTTGMVCTAGQAGTPGNSGTLGTGARGIGTIGAAGYTGATATLGGIGGSGQGGGGGGGAIACDSPTDNFAGPSGGGGGAGGCGGAAGLSGQSGGSSIGILALGVTPVLMTVSITTHDGGTGGLGGDGQLGGPGGTPGNAGGSASCAGGNGGQGGVGGPGGGGAGGHSVAVAVKGSGLPDLSTTTITLGGGAPGGAGGNMDMTAQTKGDAGLACKTLDFTNPASMTACVM